MKKSIFIIILIFISYNVYSQNQDSTKNPIFYVGGYLAYMLNLHNADFNALEGYPNCCPQFRDGNGTGPGIGLLFEYPLNNRIRITGRFGVTGMSGELKQEEKIGNTEIRRSDGFETGDITDAVSEYTIGSNLLAITLEPGFAFYPIDRLNLNFGFRLGFLNSSTFDQSEILLRPGNIVFAETGTRARNEAANQEIPNINSVQFHTYLGAGYDLPIFGRASFSPELRYYLALNNVSDVSWSVNQLHIGGAVKFPLYKPDEKRKLQEFRIIRDTTVNQIVGISKPETKLTRSNDVITLEKPDKNTELEITTRYEFYETNNPRDAELRAALKVTGLNRDGTRQLNPSIVIEEIETEEGFPLLPYVFFKENDSKLNNTSMNLINSTDVANFDPNKLKWETLEIYSDLLNIVGFRMKNSRSKITLTGTNNNTDTEKGNSILSKSRAESVRDYLVNTWGIASDRISIQSRNLPAKPANNEKPEGREENQRVEISSQDLDIIAPLNLKDIVRTANPPIVEIAPELWSEVGMKNWNIKVSQNKHILREYSGKSNIETAKWDVEDEPIPSLEEPVEILLTYEDNSGKTGEIKSNLSISQLTIKKKRVELKDDKRIERFSLILFDYDKADLTDAQKRILQDVKSKIKPNSNVEISGFADRTGEELYNKELAQRRNSEVQKVLKVPSANLSLQNVGSSQLLYDNSSPEGRSYCRTVKVLVETPVE
ncbi:MAG: OmpA family protein [Candidatus Kapabacteria bacterium]|nr:OmpA family protein [Ignavibacteriota bacterium]MCW5884201.1 OmpA family protein [Candidatus Kapabacteria bacterium]